MNKFLVFILTLIFLAKPLLSYADTTFSLSLTGGKKKEDIMTVSAQIKGGKCGDDPRQIVEVMLNGVGPGFPFAADFVNSKISASLNGKEITGSKRIFTNPPMVDSIVLHADTPFTYDPKKDVVNVYVSNIRRGNVGGLAFDLYLLEHDRTDLPSYDGCFTGNKYYNTKTPLSDSELIAGDLPKTTPEVKSAVAIPTKKVTPSPTVTQAPPTPTSALVKKAAPKPQTNQSWFSLFLSSFIAIFRSKDL